jgi:hypothetical protein
MRKATGHPTRGRLLESSLVLSSMYPPHNQMSHQHRQWCVRTQEILVSGFGFGFVVIS